LRLSLWVLLPWLVSRFGFTQKESFLRHWEWTTILSWQQLPSTRERYRCISSVSGISFSMSRDADYVDTILGFGKHFWNIDPLKIRVLLVVSVIDIGQAQPNNLGDLLHWGAILPDNNASDQAFHSLLLRELASNPMIYRS